MTMYGCMEGLLKKTFARTGSGNWLSTVGCRNYLLHTVFQTNFINQDVMVFVFLPGFKDSITVLFCLISHCCLFPFRELSTILLSTTRRKHKQNSGCTEVTKPKCFMQKRCNKYLLPTKNETNFHTVTLQYNLGSNHTFL